MWFQGRMEYGPRALGHRSVLARPDRPDLRDRLNLALKRRVWYQPFCPSMLESEAARLLADWTGGPQPLDDDGVREWRRSSAPPGRRHRASTARAVRSSCADDDDGQFAELLREARAAMARRRRAQHELQHPRRAAGLLAERGDRRVPALRRRRAGDRPVPGRAGPHDRTLPRTRIVPRARWIAVRAWRWLASVTVAAGVAARAPRPATLREQLKAWQFWSLETCVAAWLACSRSCIARAAARDRLARRRADGACWPRLRVALTLFVAPRTNRIYYDEQIYQSIGQNLADLRLAQVCNDGTSSTAGCSAGAASTTSSRTRIRTLLSLAYRLFGVHAGAAFAVNAAAMALTVCAVYLLVCVLFRRPRRGAVRRSAACADAGAADVVGDGGGRAVRVAGLRGRAPVLRRILLRSGEHGGARGRRVAAAYAIQFRPESLLIAAGHRSCWLWPRRREGTASARGCGGRPPVSVARGRSRRTPVRGEERWSGARRRALLARLCCRQPPRERLVLSV